MIYCITVTCHCNTVKLVKAHTNEYRFLHTFGFHKNCSASRERERNRQLCCNGKKIKWRCQGSNPGPFSFTCKANAVPLSYIAVLEDRAFKKYIYCRTLLCCYGKGGMKWILLNIFVKPFFYERFLDWHNTRFNGLTHIFLDLWGDCYWLAKISCHMWKSWSIFLAPIFRSSW